MAGASVTRVGTLEVGTLQERPDYEEFVDPAPVVLWKGADPVEVIAFREESDLPTRSWSQSFMLATGGHEGTPFPVTRAVRVLSRDQKKHTLDLFDLAQVHTADLDGNGVDELILIRELGAVEVHGAAGTLFQHPSLGTNDVSYSAQAVHRARLPSGDTLLVVLSRAIQTQDERARQHLEPRDRSVVLRIDGAGVAALPLKLEGEVLAVGALNRPGSQVIDELLALVATGERVFLSRHRPDGTPIEEPKELYVPFSPVVPIEFAFVRHSRRAVVFHGTNRKLLFIEPDKPVNWLHAVDLEPIASADGQPALATAIDGATDAKAIVVAGSAAYAVNQEGTYFAWNQGLVPAAGPEPFLRAAPPGDGFKLVGLYPSSAGGAELLAVHTRQSGERLPALDEALAAAERFLGPEQAERFRRAVAPRLDGDDRRRDELIAADAKRQKVPLPKTEDEWKRLLPASHAAVAAERRSLAIARILAALERDSDSDGPELRRWLEALQSEAQTSFAAYRLGARLASAVAPGHLDATTRCRLNCPRVAFGAGGGALAAVVALRMAGDPADRGRLFVVRLGGGP